MTDSLPKFFAPCAALALSLCAFIAGPAVAQEKIVLKAGHATTTTSTGHQAFEFLAREMAEKTNGRVTIEIFPNSQLGNERELVEGIQQGKVDMTFVASALLGNFNQEFFALDIPFMFKDRAGVYRVLDGHIGRYLLASLEQAGIKGLGYWENGFRQLTSTWRVVKSPDDLQGLKMRTMENDVHIAAWREEGADPAPLAFSELYNALQSGQFEVQEGPINLFYDMKFYEVQSFITKTNHVYSPWPVLVSPAAYNRLSSEEKTLLMEAMDRATQYQRELAHKADDAAAAAMHTVTITELTPQELEAFSSRMGPIHEMVKKRIQPEIVDAILAEAG